MNNAQYKISIIICAEKAELPYKTNDIIIVIPSEITCPKKCTNLSFGKNLDAADKIPTKNLRNVGTKAIQRMALTVSTFPP